MRRTVLSAMTLACTAVLASTAPAFADEASPVPSAPAAEATPAPRAEPTRGPAKAVPVPREEPAQKRDRGQVAVVPEGAPDTGVTATSAGSGSGSEGALIGGGAAAVLAAGGAAVLVVRRRRATGA
ncbi:sortase-dependent protein [Streptomyces sp. DSM 41534]